MARTVNKVILLGRLGRDPEMRFTASGTPIATFTLATNRYRAGGTEGPIEETEWHNVVAWDKLAETCNQYLSKGRLVYVEGRLQTRSWEQDGQKKYRTEIIAHEVNILDSRQDGAPVANGAGAGNGHNAEPAVALLDDDELPF